MADPQTYYFALPSDQAPAFVSLAEEVHEDFGCSPRTGPAPRP